MSNTASTVIVVLFLCALLGAMIGAPKGLGGAGFILGLILGLIGVIIVAVMQPAHGPPQQTAGRWWPDPYGSHQLRFYNGRAWTVHVADNGQRGFDPRPGLHE